MSQLKKQHVVGDIMGSINIWQIWGQVVHERLKFEKHSTRKRVQRERIFCRAVDCSILCNSWKS